jgi:hypothetical protein
MRMAVALLVHVFAVCAGLLPPSTVRAFSLTGGTWPSDSLTYMVNGSSFVSNLAGPTLDATGYEWWIAWSWSQWRERTGASFTFTHGGSTATPCNVANGTSEVAARSGCDVWNPSGVTCNAWARTFGRRNPLNLSNIVESDTCIFSQIGTVRPTDVLWRTKTAGMTTAEKDLPGILVHEFGHGLGLGHTTGTVMQANTYGNGNTLARFPYGDDILGIQSLYPARTGEFRRWRPYSNGIWGPEVTVTTNDVTTPTEVVEALTPTGYKFISTFVRPTGGRVYFSRTNSPLTAGSAWVQTSVDGDAWRPPAVAGRWGGLYGSLQVAAWPLSPTTSACNGMRIARSTDAFASASFSTEIGVCSANSPALAFDYHSGYFVMIYTNQELDGSANPGSTDRLLGRTSTDGLVWSAAQDLGIYSTDAPSLSCLGFMDCILGYTRGSTEIPFQLTREIGIVPATGAITLGAWAGSTNLLQRRPSVVTVDAAGSSLHHLAMSWTTTLTSLANGIGRIWTTTSWTNPISSFNWLNTSVDTPHAPTLTGSQVLGDAYLFYVR